MPIYVDYTNHRGERAWRHLIMMSMPYSTMYPPPEAEPSPSTFEVEAKRAWCVKCALGDRDTLRVLKLASIHGFHEGDTMPAPVDEDLMHELKEAARLTSPLDGDAERLVRLAKAIHDQDEEDRHLAAPRRHVVVDLVDLRRALDLAARPHLSFDKLRVANAARQLRWDVNGQIHGPLGLLWRSNELGGEVGEAQNAVKKLVRERMGIGGSRTTVLAIANELADVVICADLLALELRVNLGASVQAKFNETSAKVGIAVTL